MHSTSKPANLIDIGVNLTHDSYAADRDAVIERARSAGVTHMIVTGTSVPGSRQALQLSREHPGTLYCTAGVHPHHAGEFTAAAPAALRELLNQAETVAVGECGLDFFRNFSPPADQERAFIAQLELAVETGLPVFLHQRDAHARQVAILREYLPRISRGVAHCFTGTAAELDDCLALGLYIGITGWICDERRGLPLREIVGQIPDNRLLLETDAPYLLPRDLNPKPKSRRNEPGYLPHILRTVAACRQQDADYVGFITSKNARRFFKLKASD